MKKIILSLLFGLAFSAYADQLSVLTMPNVKFNFGRVPPQEVSMTLSVATSDEALMTAKEVPFSEFDNTVVNTMPPVKNLTSLNADLHPVSMFNYLPFEFTLFDSNNPNTVFYDCKVDKLVPYFLKNINYQLVINGPMKNQCALYMA